MRTCIVIYFVYLTYVLPADVEEGKQEQGDAPSSDSVGAAFDHLIDSYGCKS